MTDDHRAPSHGLFSQPLTRRQIFKGAAVIGAGAALAPAIAACGGGETTTSASPSAGVPKKGGSLKSGITTGSGKDAFDPHALAYEPEIAAGFQLYDRLLDLSPDAQVIPGLAEEATPNADATVWTDRLKPDVLFLRSLETHLDWPMYATRNYLIDACRQDKTFAARFQSWMANDMNWTFDPSNDRDWIAALERASRMLCYVFSNRAIFYEALRARFPELNPLTMPERSRTGQAGIYEAFRTRFEHAMRATGDYEPIIPQQTCRHLNGLRQTSYLGGAA